MRSKDELADTRVLQDECERLLILTVKNKDEDSWSYSYFVERVKLIRYNIIEMNEGPDKAREFIEENLKYSGFRVMAIESAIREQDYAVVERLALEGEKLDHDKCGLVKRRREYRYAAYRKTGNLEKQRAVASEFILDGSFEYYIKLKNTYSTSEWLTVYPKFVSQLEEQKKAYYNNNIYTRILVEEAEKHKLYEYVKNRPSEIECYCMHLVPEFEKEVYTLFLQHIEQTGASQTEAADNIYE